MCEKCAVILAGGLGTRLQPYTIALPKPLVPIGKFPILEIVIRQLSICGFERIILAVNHQADLIKAYFGNGEKWNTSIEYSLEKKRLGTMGPLTQISNLPDNFVVMNGDVLTDLRYDRFLDKHINSGAIFSISGYSREQIVDYGVLHIDNNNILGGFEEKPHIKYVVSMGVYAVSKEVLNHIPKDTYYGFDSLMLDFIHKEQKVNVEMYNGYWLDIGRPSDYEKATVDFEEKEKDFFYENISNRS